MWGQTKYTECHCPISSRRWRTSRNRAESSTERENLGIKLILPFGHRVIVGQISLLNEMPHPAVVCSRNG